MKSGNVRDRALTNICDGMELLGEFLINGPYSYIYVSFPNYHGFK